MADDDRKLVETALRAIASPNGLRGPAEVLDLLARRVEAADAIGLWRGFVQSPAGDHRKLVGVLGGIVAREPQVREALRSLAEAEAEAPDPGGAPRANVRIGDQSISLGENARIGRVSNEHTVKTVFQNITKRPGGVLGLVLAGTALAVAIFFATSLLRGESDEGFVVPESLTCGEYLEETAETRDRIVKGVGMELGISDAGHPGAVSSMDYYCGQAPDSRFSQVMSQGWGL